MPVVARLLDLSRCPAHVGGVIITADPSVIVCFRPVARKGDKILCLDGSIDEILEGEETVIIGGQPVALKGDPTQHGGLLLTGCPRVFSGRGLRISCKIKAAKKRAAFIKYAPGRKAPFLTQD